jgi:hypothetical protein
MDKEALGFWGRHDKGLLKVRSVNTHELVENVCYRQSTDAGGYALSYIMLKYCQRPRSVGLKTQLWDLGEVFTTSLF